jgi:hypothetical protein
MKTSATKKHVSLRLDVVLIEELKSMANKENRSFNNLVETKLNNIIRKS